MEHKVVKKTEVKVEEAKSKKDRELQEPKMSSEAELRNIVKPLVNWYRENKRDLPWRHNPGCIQGMGIRDHAAADTGRSSKRIL